MNPSDFRPADTSSTAIHAALLKAQEAQGQIQKTIAEHKAKRDSLLLDGDAKQLAAAEQTLRNSRDMVERIDAIVLELSARHEAARRREGKARVADAAAAHAAADAALAKWWRESGPRIREMLLEGHRHASGASDAAGDYHRHMTTLRQRFPEAEGEMPTLASSEESNAWNRDRVIAGWIEGQVDPSDIR